MTPPALGPLLLVGGYGVVGHHLARLLRARHPEMPLILAGRNPGSGARLAEEAGNATTAAVDVADRHPLAAVPERPCAVVTAVPDARDSVLADCLAAGIPLADIAREPDAALAAATRVATSSAQSPVLLASGLMAGLAPLFARTCVEELGGAETIEIAVGYTFGDRLGPAALSFFAQLAKPLLTFDDGHLISKPALSDSRRLPLAGGRKRVYRIGSLEQITLPSTLGARSVSAHMAIAPAGVTQALVIARRVGMLGPLTSGPMRPLLLRVISRSAHASARPAALVVTARSGTERVRITATDAQGQAHLAAVGALVAVERLLGLDGAAPPPNGLVLPEQTPASTAALRTVEDCGVPLESERPSS